jgi:cyclopropane-fatty-acyl-phospholipid synthase
MPSEELLLRFQRDLQLEQRWRVNGRHYEKTARAWLANLDAARADIRELFGFVYGPDQSRRWLERWRLFFLACAELFGYNDGEEWLVVHYLFRRAEDSPPSPAAN